MTLEHRYPDYSGRVQRAAEALRGRQIDALLITPGADMTYLTGFEHGHAGERLLAFVLRADGSFAWISPAMNVRQIDSHGLGGGEVRGWTDAETYLPALREYVGDAATIAFDDEARSAFLMDLREVVPAAAISKSSAILRGLRARKGADELALMRAAARTVDETIPAAIALCVPGRTESDIDGRLRKALLTHSPDDAVAFTIIASGENSSYPHHETERRKLKQGDVVILDYGTRHEGYHSDITVTCSVGEPADPEVRKVYRVVWEAQQKALEAIRPGVPCEAIDQAARAHIEAAGYGEYFIHRTGHGLGLQVHEPPYMVAGNTELLEEGMTFSIEPGIYLPGRFGVRLEVIAAVGANGVSPINAPSAPELPISG
jgi:D-alanyl-D-alanine dipeptidase